MAPCPASAQLLQGSRAWGSTCSDPWSLLWLCSLLDKNILAQMLSSAALAWPGTAQTLQSGASFLTWLLPKPIFCHIFLPYTRSSSCFSILLLLLPHLGLRYFSLAALADARKGLRQSKNTIKTTQLPLPPHVLGLGFFPFWLFFSSFFSSQVPCTHMWLPDWLSLAGQVIHGGPMPLLTLTPLCAAHRADYPWRQWHCATSPPDTAVCPHSPGTAQRHC